MGIKKEPSAEVVFTDLPYRVYQEPNLLYFTGIKQKQIALWLNPIKAKNSNTTLIEEILFVPSKSKNQEFWQGYQLGLLLAESSNIKNSQHEKMEYDLLSSKKTIQHLTGFVEIECYTDLVKILLREITKSKDYRLGIFQNYSKQKKCLRKDIHYFLNQNLIKDITKFNRRSFAGFLNLLFRSKKIIFPLVNEIIWQQRLKIDTSDQKHLQTACQIAQNAFLKVLKNGVSSAKNEKEIQAYLEYQIKSYSEYGEAFSTIVANGENANILHYLKNDDLIESNTLLLLDFGVRYHHMHCDISRTFPVSGIFNPLQRLLYEIVLATNHYVETQVKPGVSLQKLNQLAWDYLEGKLEKDFLKRGGKMQRSYEKSPHGIGHLLGYQVHDGDPFGDYKERGLREGEVITNEPGLYGTFSLEIAGRVFTETLGIRIEDDLLLTARGCINLTQKCPKEVRELEKLLGR